MYVKDYMTTELITITPQTSVTEAQDLLRKHDINRLPVLKNNKLVGMVTKDLINRNLPSNATSLSRNEINYLLEKTSAEDIMAKKLFSVNPDTLLDQAATTMAENNLGVLVVLAEDNLVGVITDKDIFKAFVDISGSREPGTTLVVELPKDQEGVIEEIGDALVESENNLTHMIVYYHVQNAIRIVMSVNSNKIDELVKSIENRGYVVKSVTNK
ncbi:CBS domain-containing protein [Aerococcaceae bacterium DSM 111021]|nr:CBS domain-containing protein [Aerococcaceae bacterium DSM 111021]